MTQFHAVLTIGNLMFIQGCTFVLENLSNLRLKLLGFQHKSSLYNTYLLSTYFTCVQLKN